jgi:hypothetical protein
LEEVIDAGDDINTLFLSMSMVPISNGGGSGITATPHTTFPFMPTTVPAPTGHAAGFSSLRTHDPSLAPSGISDTPTSSPAGTGMAPTADNLFSVSSIPSYYPSLEPNNNSELPTTSPLLTARTPTIDDLSTIPSDHPSLVPTGISDVPTSSPLIASWSTQGITTFGCDGGLTTGTPLDVIPISLTVTYRAESTSDATAAFVASMEQHLLETAVLTALHGCNGSVRRHLDKNNGPIRDENRRHLQVETLSISNGRAHPKHFIGPIPSPALTHV